MSRRNHLNGHFKRALCVLAGVVALMPGDIAAQSAADAADANPAAAPANVLAREVAAPSPAAAKKEAAKKAGAEQKDILQKHMGGSEDVFQQALIYIYNTHPQLQAQLESLKATDESVAQVLSGFRPDIRATYGRGRVNTDREDGAIAENKGLNVTQPVFDGFSTYSGFKAAKARVEAARADFTALEQQVLLNGIGAYTAVVSSQAVLKVNQNNVDLLNKQYQATKARFEVGEVTRTDLAQAQARLATAKAQERQALGTLQADRATFRRIIGFDAPDGLLLPEAPESLPASLEAALAVAEKNEPTLEAAQKLEQARLKDVDALSGALLPSVNLTGNMRRVENTVGGSQAVSNDSVFLNVTLPLYQSGAEWSRIRQAKHLAQQAKFTALDTKNAVTESVSRAWQLYKAAREVIESAGEAVKAAEVAIASIREESRLGSRTILDVLNTQQDMFNAQVALVNARVTERQAAYRLLASVGQLTAEDMKLPVSEFDANQHYDKVKFKLIGF